MSLGSLAAKLASKITAAKNAIKARAAVVRQSMHNAAESLQKSIREVVRNPTEVREIRRESLPTQNVSRETLSVGEDIADRSSNNETFKFLLRNAGDPFLSPYTPDQVNGFFTLTRFIWNKPEIPLEKRLDAIADYFNEPLDVIFDWFMNTQEYSDWIEGYYNGEIQSPDVYFEPYAVHGWQVRGSVQ